MDLREHIAELEQIRQRLQEMADQMVDSDQGAVAEILASLAFAAESALLKLTEVKQDEA
jgi:hypothetical protein